MNADQYHEILGGLDKVLSCFDRAGVLLTPADLWLRHELRVLRSRVLKAESGHPFPLRPEVQKLPPDEPDPEMTPAPWQMGFDPRNG